MSILNINPNPVYTYKLTVSISAQTVEKIERLKGEQELRSVSAAYRHLLTNRKVVKKVYEFSLEKTMWELSGIRGEIDLMLVTLELIRKKMSTDNNPVNDLDTMAIQLLRVLEQLSDNKKILFKQIDKLSYIWLTK